MFSVHFDDCVQQASNSFMCSQQIKQCMREYIPDDTVVPQEAIAALLGSCPTSYSHDEDAASSTLVSYQPGNTSLPEIASPAPDVVSVLDSQASQTLVDFEKERMIRQSAYDERILEEGKTEPYVVPSLTSNQHSYENNMSEICSLHIVDCTQTPKEHVGIFVCQT